MLPIRLTVSEAARLFGLDPKTIRRAIKRGELHYVVIRGRYRINFESILKWSQRQPKTANKLANTGIGRYVDQWKLSTPLYSPNPKQVTPDEEDGEPKSDEPTPAAPLSVAPKKTKSVDTPSPTDAPLPDQPSATIPIPPDPNDVPL